MDPLLLVLLGPTASGKTALSLHLAERFQGEIISCDSVAVYREFEIGTAKPALQDRKRIPHHLIDVADPTEQFTAGDYSRLARAAINQIHARGHMPIVVGGTGLYLRALLEGLFAGPARSEELRERLRQRQATRGAEHLHRLLRKLDPPAAATIHANDVPKLIRAIEVCLSARQSMTTMWQSGRDPLRGFRILRIGLNPTREALYQRVNLRALAMFKQGQKGQEQEQDKNKDWWKKRGCSKIAMAKQRVLLLRWVISRHNSFFAENYLLNRRSPPPSRAIAIMPRDR